MCIWNESISRINTSDLDEWYWQYGLEKLHECKVRNVNIGDGQLIYEL